MRNEDRSKKQRPAETSRPNQPPKKIDLIAPLLLTMAVVFVAISGYELAKYLIFPDIETWKSHLVTIIVGATAATGVAYFMLRKYRLMLQQMATEIARRRQAEAALQEERAGLKQHGAKQTSNFSESEARFQALAESTTAAISIIQDNRLVYVNPAAATLTGYTRQELLTMNFLDILHPDFHEFVKERLTARSQGDQAPSHHEIKILTKNGQTRWLDLTSGTFELEGRTAILTTTFDITGRKQMEEELRLSQTITRSIGDAEDFDSALETVLRQICQATGWDFGEIWLPTAGGTVLECSSAWYSRSDSLKKFRTLSEQITFPPGEGLPGRVWSSKQPEWVQDISIRPKGVFRRAQFAREIGLKAGIGLPLVANGQILAVLVFFTFKPNPEDKRLTALVSAVIKQLSVAIQRKRAEAGRQKLANALEQIADSVVITNANGVIEYVNPAFERITGYSKEEALGQTPRILKSGRHKLSFYRQLWQTILAGRVFQVTLTNRRQDGRLYYESRTITSLKDSRGRITHFVSTGRDITRRWLTQQALQKSKDRLAEAQRIAHLGHWEWHIVKGELRWSDEIYRIFELTPQEFGATYQAFLNTIHPDDRVPVEQAVNDALYHNKPYNIEHRIVLPDGAERVVCEQAEVTFDKKGRPIEMVGTVQDITERKQLEERLAAIYYLGQELIILHNEKSIIRRVLKTTTDVIACEIAGYGRVDEAAGVLEYRYYLVGDSFTPVNLRLPLAKDQARGIGPAVIHSGQALNIPDVTPDARYVPWPDTPSIRSELCVAIKVKKQTIGVLNIGGDEPDCFSLADQQLLQTLADQTAAALENVRLYAEVQQHAGELSSLNVIIGDMTSRLELEAVLDQAIAGAKILLQAKECSVLLYDPANDALVFTAVTNPGAEEMLGQPVPMAGSLAGQAVQKQESILVENVQTDPRFYRQIDELTGLTTQSLIATPLIFKNQVIGVIEAINKTTGRFDLHDLDILEMLAGPAAIAIDRAKLFKAEHRQRRLAETLSQVTMAINASLELNEVLERILIELEKVITYDSANVMLLEDDVLRVVAQRGYTEPSPFQVLSISPADIPLAQSVIRQQRPLLISDTQQEPLFNPVLPGLAAIRCLIRLPLIRRQKTIGLLSIDSWSPHRYSEQDATVAARFAEQAVVAIENARLYETVQAQYHRLQQSQAQLIQSEKMAALGRLVGSIAHEINNPIQAVQNCMALLQEEVNDRQRPDKLVLYADIAKTELIRMAEIIRRMRDFYRSPARRMETASPDEVSEDDFYRLAPEELQVVNLQTIIEEVLQLTNKQLQHGQVKVERTWSDDLPAVEGSPDHLKQVFLNLTLNAIDAMIEQGGVLHIRTGLEQADLPGGEQQPAACIEFSDTGAGIPPEVLPHIFEPLLTTKTHGMGFGLFISYKIIKAHYGQITAESRAGQGATFIVLLPLTQP